MARRQLIFLILVFLLCIGVFVPIILFNSLEKTNESAVVMVDEVVQTIHTPVTAGVILTGDAADFGWDDVPADGADFAKTSINGIPVIVLDRLNATYRPGLTLKWAVEGVLDRGATVVFVSSAYLSESDEVRVSEQYPNTVFIMNLSTRDNVAQLLNALPGTVSDMHPGALKEDSAVYSPGASTSETEDSGTKSRGIAIVLVSIMVVVIALIISLIISARVLTRVWERATPAPEKSGKRKRRTTSNNAHGREIALEAEARRRMTDFSVLDGKEPVIHEISTYVLGDQFFDESFPIELASGEFLGECGLSISEPVNRYDKDKVSAFELWLFDKRAISTTTAVLASEYAAKSLSTRDKLAEKGTVYQSEPGTVITLETETLHLHARILGMNYGFVDTLPVRSFFDHIVVEIAVLPH